MTVPKMKTSSGARKRFKLSAGGKVMRRRAFASHLFEHKSAKRRRSKRRPAPLAGADSREAKRLLGKR
jgi:large subunit ribosomal protein L35